MMIKSLLVFLVVAVALVTASGYDDRRGYGYGGYGYGGDENRDGLPDR